MKKIPELDLSKPWAIRRIIVISSLLFCFFCIAYVMFKQIDSRLNEVIVTDSYLMIAGLIGAYVFGRTWQFKLDQGKCSQISNSE